MGGRLIFISLISFLGISFLAIIAGMYFYMKRTVSGGKSLLDEAVNMEENTSRMTLGELLVYVSAILVALLFAVRLMDLISISSRVILLTEIMVHYFLPVFFKNILVIGVFLLKKGFDEIVILYTILLIFL